MVLMEETLTLEDLIAFKFPELEQQQQTVVFDLPNSVDISGVLSQPLLELQKQFAVS